MLYVVRKFYKEVLHTLFWTVTHFPMIFWQRVILWRFLLSLLFFCLWQSWSARCTGQPGLLCFKLFLFLRLLALLLDWEILLEIIIASTRNMVKPLTVFLAFYFISGFLISSILPTFMLAHWIILRRSKYCRSCFRRSWRGLTRYRACPFTSWCRVNTEHQRNAYLFELTGIMRSCI